MNRLQKPLTGVALACAVAMSVGGATAATGGWGAQAAASAVCQSANSFPVYTGATGLTAGIGSTAFVTGDRVSITVELGTATSSSVAIVGNSTGTPVRFADRAEIESLLDACAADGYRTRDLLHALVQSKIFLGQESSDARP